MNYAASLPWTLDQIDWGQSMSRACDATRTYFSCFAAPRSWSGSDLYTKNLVNTSLATKRCKPGPVSIESDCSTGALSAYVRAVWPEFDWDAAFAAFWQTYGAVCTAAQLESSRGLELAARCVVETGTASLHRALHAITDEPVLQQLTGHSKSDEVRHCKHFYQHFQLYRERERKGLGRYKVLCAVLLRRLNEISSEDSDIAVPRVQSALSAIEGQQGRVPAPQPERARLATEHIPAEMTVQMLLKPLAFPPKLQSAMPRPLARMGGRLVLP